MSDDGISFNEAEQMDMDGAVVKGYNSAVIVLLAALKRAGARKVSFGYVEEDVNDKWPDEAITAFCTVNWNIRTGYKLGEMETREEVLAERGTQIDDPGKAIIEAVARCVRFAGGKVAIEAL